MRSFRRISGKLAVARSMALPTLAMSVMAASVAAAVQIPVERMVGTPAGPRESLAMLSAVVDDSDRVHLVWMREGPGTNRARGRISTWYRRGNADELTWDEPIQLAADDVQPPHIVCLGHELHAILGPQLRDLVSRDQGRSWSEAPELNPLDRPHPSAALHSGVTATDSTITAAWLGDDVGSQLRFEGHDGHPRLSVLRAFGRESSGPVLLGSQLPDEARQAEPQVVRTPSSIYVVCTFNRLLEHTGYDPAGGSLKLGPARGNLIAYRSSDAGRTWVGPLHMLADDMAVSRIASIDRAQCIPDGGGVRVLFSSGEHLYSTELDSNVWRDPRPVPGVSITVARSDSPYSFAWAPSDAGGLLVWVTKAGTSPPLTMQYLHGDRSRDMPCQVNCAKAKFEAGELVLGQQVVLSGTADLIPAVAVVRLQRSILAMWVEQASEREALDATRLTPCIMYRRIPLGLVWTPSR